jgi:hypothetical protein
LSCFVIIINARNLKAPRFELSATPCFAELVVHYLPEDEWTNAKGSNYAERGAEWGILTRHHYNLLKTHPGCHQIRLENAFEDWLKMGEHEFGESQRNFVYSWYSSWMRNRRFYAEVQSKLTSVEYWNALFSQAEKEMPLRDTKKLREWRTWEMEEYEEDLKLQGDNPPPDLWNVVMAAVRVKETGLGTHFYPRQMAVRRSKQVAKHM